MISEFRYEVEVECRSPLCTFDKLKSCTRQSSIARLRPVDLLHPASHVTSPSPTLSSCSSILPPASRLPLPKRNANVAYRTSDPEVALRPRERPSTSTKLLASSLTWRTGQPTWL